MKILSDAFVNDLINSDGLLYPLLERVKRDHTLLLAVRDDYINIYYRGGNLLKVEKSGNSYKTYFDEKYDKDQLNREKYSKVIACQADAKECVEKFKYFKEIMDLYFSVYSKPEREFQQLVVRENNFSTISNESEYFIADIEHAVSDGCFDMLGIHWPASQRKNPSNCHPVLIEMKYGDNALEGPSGLVKHLDDIVTIVCDVNKRKKLFDSIASKCNQLDKLGLLKFNRSKNFDKFEFKDDCKLEVIFILANHNPRSTVLNKIITEILCENKKYGCLDIRFFVSSFCGYSMHTKSMHTVLKMRDILNSHSS